MRNLYEDYLFSQGYLVANSASERRVQNAYPAEALVALAYYAGIRITAHPELADLHMVEVAARNIGEDVPEPFMRGFPQTARDLSPVALYFDQFIHYMRTYGLGDFSEPGHSLFEEHYERAAFDEDVEQALFAIVTPDEALGMLNRAIKGFLANTRPLSNANYALLSQYLKDYGLPTKECACKDTACRLLIELRDPRLSDLITLPDVIRLVEWVLDVEYPFMTINKLNLNNRDRKLVSSVLDRLFERGNCDIVTCLEKKRTWNGLLHHIHYRPQCDEARAFCDAVRGHRMRSAYSEFERLLQGGDVRGAVDSLRASKGPVAVMRNLDYLLSRCDSTDDVRYVLDAVETTNKIVLLQLFTHLHKLSDREWGTPRVFEFVHMNKTLKHVETDREMARRKTRIDEGVRQQTLAHVEKRLEQACHGTLGKVHVDEDMRQVALPLQEAASMSGFGTLPRGTQLGVPSGKKLRAFVYWEKVDDIDLSCIGFGQDGLKQEFSWRSMAGLQSEAITFSGDQTSGYLGGSEYFDVDVAAFQSVYPGIRYLIFCANVFTCGARFSDCVCRAGFMLRALEDSGAVFEPKTVKSSFTVNCNSASAYLFALDLEKSMFVWLNLAEESDRRIAGEGDMSFLLDYMDSVGRMNLYRFAQMLATEIVDTPEEADSVFSDADLDLAEGQEQIRSIDIARVIELLNS